VRVADTAAASEEHPAVLEVIGDVAAGSGELPTVGPGQAARIMTGAPLPPGAAGIAPVEWTDGGAGGGPATAMTAHSTDPSGAAGEVRVHRPVRHGEFVRARGSDVAAGELALAAGTILGPAQIGLLAAIGRGTVKVRPRPRVVVVSTGSELVQPGEDLGPGQIHDSNSFALTAAARDAGAIAYRVGAVADEVETLRATIEDQLVRADIVVTSGGVSVGAYDVVKEALSSLGGGSSFGGEEGDQDAPEGGGADFGHVDFRKLAMQPGKPQGFGRIGPDRTPLLALPGNPVSAYVSFELFVRPVIRTLMGAGAVHREVVRARCVTAIEHSPQGRRQYLRGHHDRVTGTVTAVGGSGSHLVKALAHADALIVVPESSTSVAAGDEVDVILLD
jgi:molybdopterin molybdotransferase